MAGQKKEKEARKFFPREREEKGGGKVGLSLSVEMGNKLPRRRRRREEGVSDPGAILTENLLQIKKGKGEKKKKERKG